MPKFRALGQRFSAASDDFFVPALIGLGNRVGFIAASIAYVILLVRDESPLGSCSFKRTRAEDNAGQLAIASLAFFLLSAAMYASMFFVSTRGAILEPEKRSALPSVLVAFVMLWFAEIALAAVATELLLRWPSDEGIAAPAGAPPELLAEIDACLELYDAKLAAVAVGAAFFWADLVTHALSAYFFLHRYGAKAGRAPGVRLDEGARIEAEWEGCFRVWCGALRFATCGLFGFVTRGEEAGEMYSGVAAVFASWFADTNLTMTDLVTALILIRAEQKEDQRVQMKFVRYDPTKSEIVPGATRTEQKRYNVMDSSVRVLGAAEARVKPVTDDEEDTEAAAQPRVVTPAPSAEEALAQLRELYDYMPYMIAMYGWKLLLYAHTVRLKPLTGLRKLLRMPTRPKAGAARLGDGDNSCGCAQQALLGEVQDLEPEHVIYATFSSVAARGAKAAAFVQIPHAVMVDHKRRAVVVAMRGTLSLQDIMTDCMVEPASLGRAGRAWGFDGGPHHAHEGFLRVAMRIRAVLEHSQVLHSLLGVEKKNFAAYSEDKDAAQDAAAHVDLTALPDCKGYRLVIIGHSLGAGVAALLTLMLRPTFPEARCLAFAGPGTVLSAALAEESADWCTNVFLGKDMVPQLSWRSLTHLRDQAIDVLCRAKVSKARVLRSVLRAEPLDNLLYAKGEAVPRSATRDALRAAQKRLRERRLEESSRLEQIPLFAPGALIHLAKLETARVPGSLCPPRIGHKVRVLEPHWVTDRSVFAPMIGTRSLLDHFPDLMPEALRDVLERYGGTEAPSRKPTL